MTSTIKVDNIQDQDGNNIINENANTITIGASGDTVTLASGASQSGFGRTGTVDWDTTAKTASFTAVSGEGYFVNTTSGAITVTLPAGSAGDIVSLADYAATWQTNNVTVTPNGTDKIGGVNADAVLDTEGQSITFVYVDSTQGWINTMDSTSNVRANEFIIATGGTITTCGNCKIHTFTGPGTFTVCSVANCASQNIVSYAVVAGGGGSGGNRWHIQGGGGGGAGGFRELKNPVTPYTASPLDGYPSAPNRVTITATAYPITVGAGGAAGGTGGGPGGPLPEGANATNGANSVFSTITSAGGGFGGNPRCQGPAQPEGNPGGSGGGGGGGSPARAGGTGNTPPTSPAQGTNGAPGSASNQTLGGSGGGATAAGTTSPGCSPPPSANSGGTGATTGISGSNTTYSSGGDYSSYNPAGADPSSAGADNTGDGGNAANAGPGSSTPISPLNNYSGRAGGSGIVIIRYKFQ